MFSVRYPGTADIHLGEAALALLRNGEFEIPHMRSRISKQQQQLTDLEKRLTEYQRGIQASQADYAKARLTQVKTLHGQVDSQNYVVINSNSFINTTV